MCMYMSAIIYCRSGNFSITNKHFLINSYRKMTCTFKININYQLFIESSIIVGDIIFIILLFVCYRIELRFL